VFHDDDCDDDDDDDDKVMLHLQCFLFLTTVDMGFNMQVLLYVRNIAMMPVAKIQQAWDYFCWISLYSIKLLGTIKSQVTN